MNSHILKVNGNAELEKQLEINNKEFSINLVGSITSITKKTQDNGFFNFYYTFKPNMITGINDLGEKLTVPKQKGSLSQQNQQTLAQIFKYQIRDKYEIDYLKFYGMFWEVLNNEYYPKIIESLIAKLDKENKA